MVASLSGRQRQIAELVTRGKGNRDIAEELGLSQGTVKEYMHRLFRQLGLHNRTGLAVWMLTHGGAKTPRRNRWPQPTTSTN